MEDRKTKGSHSISARENVKRNATGELNSSSNCHKGFSSILTFFGSFLLNLRYQNTNGVFLLLHDKKIHMVSDNSLSFSVATCPDFRLLVYPSLKSFQGKGEGYEEHWLAAAHALDLMIADDL